LRCLLLLLLLLHLHPHLMLPHRLLLNALDVLLHGQAGLLSLRGYLLLHLADLFWRRLLPWLKAGEWTARAKAGLRWCLRLSHD